MNIVPADMQLSRIPKVDKKWSRTLAAGTLVTGAILLASGRRKAGITLAVGGTVFALMEDAEGISSAWENLPQYLRTGQKWLGNFEKFIAELAVQGETLHALLARERS